MKITVIGGAGFIGSNLIGSLLQKTGGEVLAYDNFSSGTHWHLSPYVGNPRLKVSEADILDNDRLMTALQGCDLLYHLASNPDISLAATEPAVDFDRGTLLTHRVLEAARKSGVKLIIYASGSGVFGDDAAREFDEEGFSPKPTSTYAASKIAGEALLSAYCHMFGMNGLTFRFANVVGPNQTHGVGYDFIRKLKANPRRLEVLGNGTQSKSYIYVDDVLAGLTMFLGGNIREKRAYDYFNLCTGDYITVKEIAQLVIKELQLTDVDVAYGTSSKGWSGDVPIIRFSSEKIRRLGWKNNYTSHVAMQKSVAGMIQNFSRANSR